MNMGVIGVGRIGKLHIENIINHVKNINIKAIADPYITKEIEIWIKEKGIESVYYDYKEMLKRDDIDAVLICSSTDTHANISIESALAGKHIFCEKPIDVTLSKIKEVIRVIEQTKVKYQVGFNRRFDHNFKEMRKKIDSGLIGVPQIVNIVSRDPERPLIEFVKTSGGLFLDFTIHDFDMASFLVGSDIEEVYVIGGVLIDDEIGKVGDIDTALISVKFKNGALGIIDNSREAVYGYDQRAEVFGSKGSVKISNDTLSKVIFSSKDGVISEKPLFSFLERYKGSFIDELTEFANSVIEDKETLVNAVDGLKPILACLAAKKSLDEKRPIKISELE